LRTKAGARLHEARTTVQVFRDHLGGRANGVRDVAFWHKAADVGGPAYDFRSLRQNRHGRFGTASEKAGIRRRMRIQDVQLTAAKVSNPGIRGKARNSPDNSKGISQLGMCKFESSQVSQAVTQPEEVGAYASKSTAFHRLSVRRSRVSSLPKMATLARICRKSQAQAAEIPVFEETIGGDWFDQH
jgi:hypothetical protein